MARVIWQDNPHNNGAVDNTVGTWTYGKYGGKGWTGGEFTPPNIDPKLDLEPDDELDAVFQVHDKNYEERDKAWENSAKTEADVAKYWQATIAADKAMRESIQALNRSWDELRNTGTPPDFDMLNAATQASNLFLFKGLLDQKSLEDLQNPDGSPDQEIPNPDGSIPEDPWYGQIPNDPALRRLLKDLRATTPRDDSALSAIQQKTQTASAYASPIILDLNGDGVVGTVGLDAGVYFDHAADGFAERTGWLAPGDGLLVWDRNANGAIDSGRELLGSESLLPNGLKAVNGFEALKALDANGDGVINASDPAFAQLRVWVDADSQGRTGPGELLTLEQAGVLSMGVAYANSAYVDAQGNAHRQVGSYTTTHGQARLASDVWFQADATYSVPTDRTGSRRSLREAANGQVWRIRA